MILYSRETLSHAPAYGWDHGKGDRYMDDPTRVSAILSALRKAGWSERMKRPRPIELESILAVHSSALVAHIRATQCLEEDQAVYPYVFPYRSDFCSPRTRLMEAGYYCFDVGTVMHRGTFPAARASAATAMEGARQICDEGVRRVFALTRPPGHHADRDFYGGLCFFNNAAIAARHLAVRGRVAILDLDFHHGNGTQGIFYCDPDVLYVSIHGDPRRHFPFLSGHADETGRGPGEGLTLNYPLPEQVDLKRYRIYLDRALARIQSFEPWAVVVSMGFDTHRSEVLGDALFRSGDFRGIGEVLRRMKGPVLVCLEGGYDVDSLGENVVQFVTGFLG